MTGVGGSGGEDEDSTYPDSDKYIVEDIKKAIKEQDSGLEEKEDSAKRDSEQSNNKDENN